MIIKSSSLKKKKDNHIKILNFAVSINVADYLGSILSYIAIAFPIFFGHYDNLTPTDLSSLISRVSFYNVYGLPMKIGCNALGILCPYACNKRAQFPKLIRQELLNMTNSEIVPVMYEKDLEIKTILTWFQDWPCYTGVLWLLRYAGRPTPKRIKRWSR